MPSRPAPRLLVLDIDGVLTDGKDVVLLGEKQLYLRDLDALGRARRSGLLVAFLTGEGETSARIVVERCGGGPALFGQKDKADGICALASQLEVPLEEVCYVGDADRDEPAFRLVGLALAPADGSARARGAAHVVLPSRGGEGVVEDAVNLILGSDEMSLEEIGASIEEDLTASARILETAARTLSDELAKVTRIMADSLLAGGKIVVFGNGGSAALAQHLAAELVGRFEKHREPLPAVALTADTVVVTALGNDFGFDDIFKRQISGCLRFGDVALGMSTSGQSVNVARALSVAAARGGRTIAFVGRDAGVVGEEAQLCIAFPAQRAATVQELHLAALHAICARLDALLSNHSTDREEQ